jgi:hypothetical protein
MFQKNSILLVLLFLAFNSKAQDVTKNGTPSNQRFSFSAGYLGYKLANPGLQLGVEKHLATTNNFNVIGGLLLNYYNESKVQSAVGLHARIGQRYTAGFGLFLETYLGIGVQQTFFTNQTYEYNAGVSTIKETKTSKPSLSPSITLGLGYDFNKKMDLPIKWYLRPSFYWIYPERNLLLQTSYALETGIVYTLKRGRK